MRPYPNFGRLYTDWAALNEWRLEAWWDQWAPTLDRHDSLRRAAISGDNFGFFGKQMGFGRTHFLAKAVADAARPADNILVLCPPVVKQFWCQEFIKAGLPANKIAAESAYLAVSQKLRSQAALLEKIDAADVLIIEPPCRPKTKMFAGLAKQVREAAHTTQIITTTTIVWSSVTAPPRYLDSCLKLLGYLDAPEDIKVAWTEDCWSST